MKDLISRQMAIKAIDGLQNCYNGFSDTYDKACIIGVIEELPSAQPETHEKRTETHGVCSDDLIKRTDAIDAIEECIKANGYGNVALVSELNRLDGYIRQLPSVQPEIIRCKDCKNHDWCSIEDTALNDEMFFCKWGERRE